MSICYDIRFPHLYRAQAHAGAAALTAPAAFTRQTGEAHWHVLQRARAIENGAFVISAAQAGRHADGRETFGHSIIVSPWGEVLAEGGGEGPEVIIADDRSGPIRRCAPAHPGADERAAFRASRMRRAPAAEVGVVIRYSLACERGTSSKAGLPAPRHSKHSRRRQHRVPDLWLDVRSTRR